MQAANLADQELSPKVKMPNPSGDTCYRVGRKERLKKNMQTLQHRLSYCELQGKAFVVFTIFLEKPITISEIDV